MSTVDKSKSVYVVGIGMTKFMKPSEDIDYPDLVKEAVQKCLNDCNVAFSDIDHGVCSYVYGDSTCGQNALYNIGMTGIPIINVNNNCASGSSGIYMAYSLIKSGMSACTIVVGFEKMQKGSLTSVFNDRSNPMEKHVDILVNNFGFESSPVVAQLFGNAGREHMKNYGTKLEHFAKIAWKNHKHSVNNPNSQFQTEYSLEEIMKSPMIHEPLTKLQCCPTSDGAAAVLITNSDFVKKHNLFKQAVEIIGISLVTDTAKSFSGKSAMQLVGYDMTVKAAQSVYNQCELKPKDFQVIELHDCFSANELITYEALDLCPPGQAGNFIDNGDNTYGGKHVINPSGGLISKGHPLGATGVAQCVELCLHLRNEAGKRQVQSATYALQHNLGLGGAGFVAAYKKGFSVVPVARL